MIHNAADSIQNNVEIVDNEMFDDEFFSESNTDNDSSSSESEEMSTDYSEQDSNYSNNDFFAQNDDDGSEFGGNVFTCDDIDFDEHQNIHENLSCTIKEAMNVIFAFTTRHNSNWQETEDLLVLINTIIGKKSLPTSKYLFKKFFLYKNDLKLDVHICCAKCDKYLGTRESMIESNLQLCDNCHQSVDVSTKYKKNHFIITSVESQIKDTLERNMNFVDLSHSTSENSAICDVHDASNFKHLNLKMNTDYITLTMNSDGAAVFKSTRHKSFWPIQCFVNEIDINKRFKRENMICSGFSFGKTPNMCTFLRFFIEEINAINSSGGMEISLTNNEKRKIKVIPMILSVDTQAKGYILNKSGANGYFGCSYCTHEGSLIEGTRKVRYCNRDNGSERTNETVKMDMINAHTNKIRTNGFNGVSALLALDTNFDTVWQVVIDKMHNLDLGVIKKLFNLFLQSRNGNKE